MCYPVYKYLNLLETYINNNQKCNLIFLKMPVKNVFYVHGYLISTEQWDLTSLIWLVMLIMCLAAGQVIFMAKMG